MSTNPHYPININRLEDDKSKKPHQQSNTCYRLLWLNDGSGLLFLHPHADLPVKLLGRRGWAILFGERQYSRFKNHYRFFIPYLENKLVSQHTFIPLKKPTLDLLEIYAARLKYALDHDLSPLKIQIEFNQILKVTAEAYDLMQNIMTGLKISNIVRTHSIRQGIIKQEAGSADG